MRPWKNVTLQSTKKDTGDQIDNTDVQDKLGDQKTWTSNVENPYINFKEQPQMPFKKVFFISLLLEMLQKKLQTGLKTVSYRTQPLCFQ